MKLYTGTSGFSYKEWRGSFYPEDLASKGWLNYYASKLSSVEINNTFYRMPKASVLEGWAAETPDDFRFVIKASRRITHFKRLKEVEKDVSFLLGQLEALGPRLGPVLYQLPPNAKADLDRLATFLELVPPGSSAFEFRNPSWHTDEVHALLRARDCALVLSETDDESPEIVSTAPWGYLRLRKTEYGEDELVRWQKRLDEQNWDRAFVFFKHEDAGTGPRLAGEFAGR